MSADTITDTVWDFIDRAAPLYARVEAQRFAFDMHQNCLECGMESPIEHLFWIASYAICRAQGSDFNPSPIEYDGRTLVPSSIYLTPQFSVGKYRVDFLLSSSGFGPADVYTPVVVELDGHQFHDRDKRQRSYEKARDRALVRAGFRVIHFTGSDVVRDPFACAWEALEMVGCFVGSSVDKYDPKNPLCLDLD